MNKLKAIILFLLKLLIRLTFAKIVFILLIDRVVVKGQVDFEKLKEPASFILIFLFIVLIFYPSQKTIFVTPSEFEMKRTNDLKEKELELLSNLNKKANEVNN